MVWAFDLGKGSIGEAVRRGTEFLHKASRPWRDEVKRRRLIPADFAETKTAANRRRMWRMWQNELPARAK
jgi:predicted metal-dependent peptidase